MKKLALALSCCALTLSATAASAAGVYVSGNLGLSVPPDLTLTENYGAVSLYGDVSLDTGFALNGAVGYDFDNFRAEAEIGYQENDLDSVKLSAGFGNFQFGLDPDFPVDGELEVMSYFANGYYDFKNTSAFTPFLGVGIGWATVDFNLDRLNYSNDDTVFAYQVMAGVSYALSKNMAFDLSYRYVGADDPTFSNAYTVDTEFEFSSHNFLLGVRYTF